MEVLILLINIFANLYLLYYLSKRQELRRKYQYWAIVIILISSMIWSGTNICFYVFDPSNLYWIAIISYISGLFINLGSFSFLFTYNDNPIRKRQKIIIFLSYVFVFLVSIWTIIPGNVLLKIDVDQNNHWKLITAHGIIVYGVFIAIASVLNVILAIFKYFSLNKQERIKFVGILVTVTLSSVGGFIFNMYLPVLGNYKFTWLGPSFVIIWVLYMVYAIIKYSIFNIKIVIGKSVYILVTSLFLLFFYLGVYKLQVFLWSDLLSKNAIILGFFISVIFVILFDRLTSYFNEFVDNTIIYNKRSNPYKITKFFVEKIALEMDVGSLMKITIRTLYHLFKPNFVSIIIVDKQENLSIEGEKIFSNTSKLNNFIEIFNSCKREIIEFDALEQIKSGIIMKKKMEKLLDLKRYYPGVLAKVKKRNNLIGLIILGSKPNNNPYSIDDLEFIESLIQNFSISISRAMLYQEVQSFNEQLKTKVEEATMQLKDKIKKLQDLRQRERDMIDIMGHELRTPLTIIKNAVGIIDFIKKNNSKKVKWDPLIEEQYKNISDALKREIVLVETMLSATKIDADKLELNITDVDMRQMLQQLTLAFGPQAEEKGLKFDIVYDNKKKWIVKADPIRLQEVMDNLVSNAVKYTNRGFILVELIDLKKSIKVNVIDTGEGISKQDLRNIGKKFYRANQYIGDKNGKIGKMVRPGGSGLGLYVTFGLIKAMNGTIEVQSELGKGSTFSFTIPKNNSV